MFPLHLLSRVVTSALNANKNKTITNLNLRLFSMGPTTATTVSQEKAFIFRQLFDRESCTYTYLIGDPESREAILIDPVFELAERDYKLAQDLDLNLKYVLNTHVHADHITGTGLLKKMIGKTVSSAISSSAGAIADKFLEPGQNVNFGSLELEVRPTPGHTNGCICYVFHQGRRVFTGDTLLIRGCGRTDFQEGSSESLYNSVHNQLFTLPDDFLVFPAHDYKGMTCSSIGEEKRLNPRLTKTLDQFQEIMTNLNLAYPKMMDKSVPANRVCGLYNLPDEFQEKLAITQKKSEESSNPNINAVV